MGDKMPDEAYAIKHPSRNYGFWDTCSNISGTKYIRADLNEWQPIETAPKDGTEILTAEFREGEWDRVVCFYNEDRYGGGWEAREYDAFDQNPTYWMPLSQPPKEDKQCS